MIETYPFTTFTINALQKSKLGRECCGDSFLIDETDDAFICAVADGLGSGEYAKKASETAVKVIEKSLSAPLIDIMKMVNEAQRGLRGVVLSIFKLDLKSKVIEFCGIGNIRIKLYKPDGEIVHLMPKQGYLSGQSVDFNIQSLAYPDQSWFTIYSDGIHLNSNHVPTIKELFGTTDEEVAGKILNQISSRFVDDMTVVIGKPT